MIFCTKYILKIFIHAIKNRLHFTNYFKTISDSSIVAVVQSLLTILSSVFLVGCHQAYTPVSMAGHWPGENGDQPVRKKHDKQIFT